jgi:hypothetical protein
MAVSIALLTIWRQVDGDWIGLGVVGGARSFMFLSVRQDPVRQGYALEKP